MELYDIKLSEKDSPKKLLQKAFLVYSTISSI